MTLSCASFTGLTDSCQCCIIKKCQWIRIPGSCVCSCCKAMSKTELLAKLKAETIALSQVLPMHLAFQLNGPTAHLPWQHMGWTAYQCCCGFQSNPLAEKVGKVAHSSRGRSQVHCVGQQDVPPHGQKCNCASCWPFNYAGDTVSLP